MRRLAAELGVNPMSIYHHLPGKAAVVSGLVEVVFAEVRLPPGEVRTWQERVRDWAQAYRALARSHPNLALQIVSDAAAVSTAMLLVSEPLYAALEEAGLPPWMIVRASGLVVDFANGFALGEVSNQPAQPDFARELLARIEAQPEERLPTMRRVFGALTEDEARYDFDTGFDASLDILLRGLEGTADDTASKDRTE